MTKLLFIGLGGAVGSVLRYLISGWGSRFDTPPMLAGTLIVNVVGCFAIGIVVGGFGGTTWVREEHRLAVMVGLLGGFTTFSTYGLEAFTMIEAGHRWSALGHVLAHNGLGILMVWAGFRIGTRTFGV